jgi:hypothetical protein
MLIEATRRGDDDSPVQAGRLVKRYPGAAAEAIAMGIKNTSRPWTRAAMIELAGRVPGDGPLEILLTELRTGPYANTRLAAARQLRQRRPAEALAAMLDEWNQSRDAMGSGQGERGEGDNRLMATTYHDQAAIASFLAESGKVEAIEAIARNLERRSVKVRMQVVMSLRSGSNSTVDAIGTRTDPPDEHALAVQRLLVKCLDDDEQRMGLSGTWGEKGYTNPRVCDMAGYILNERWPDTYDFDLEADLDDRDQARLEIIDVWRREHGQDSDG